VSKVESGGDVSPITNVAGPPRQSCYAKLLDRFLTRIRWVIVENDETGRHAGGLQGLAHFCQHSRHATFLIIRNHCNQSSHSVAHTGGLSLKHAWSRWPRLTRIVPVRYNIGR